MKLSEIDTIIAAAEDLQNQSGKLIVAIDSVRDEPTRRDLRRDYAELIAFIEERFVFSLKKRG